MHKIKRTVFRETSLAWTERNKESSKQKGLPGPQHSTFRKQNEIATQLQRNNFLWIGKNDSKTRDKNHGEMFSGSKTEP